MRAAPVIIAHGDEVIVGEAQEVLWINEGTTIYYKDSVPSEAIIRLTPRYAMEAEYERLGKLLKGE